MFENYGEILTQDQRDRLLIGSPKGHKHDDITRFLDKAEIVYRRLYNRARELQPDWSHTMLRYASLGSVLLAVREGSLDELVSRAEAEEERHLKRLQEQENRS